MYSRKIEDVPEKLVVNHKPVFGTFKGHPLRLDIRGIFKPYGLFPLPTFITNLRIKSRLTFSFDAGEYTGSIRFIDAKIAGFAEVVFWNKSTNQRFAYHSVTGPRRRFIPHDLEKASTACYKKNRFIKISWDRKKNKFSVMFNLKGDSVRPSANGSFTADFNSDDFCESTCCCPFPTRRRANASYSAMLPLQGTVILTYPNGDTKDLQTAKGNSLFEISRVYMKFHSTGEFVSCTGCHKGKNISFKIASEIEDAVSTDKINRNILMYDGKVTPLPPVRITHPDGIKEKWIIQDTENMIDLTFTPLSVNLNQINAFVARAAYYTVYGTFEGSIMTADGEKISFKSLSGLSENYLIRL